MQDIPLLVEGGMAARFPLVVVVHADATVRVRRLVEQRGMPEADARARIAAQADDAARRAVADVWLDNSGAPEALAAAVDALWDRRLVPFAADLAAGRPAPRPPALVDPDPEWPAQAARLVARVGPRRGSGAGASRTSAPPPCPACPRRTSSTCMLGVASPADADALREPARRGGLRPRPNAAGRRRVLPRVGADPGRPARLQVRVVDSPGWRDALLPAGLVARRPGGQGPVRGGSGDGWQTLRRRRPRQWAASSGWAPSLNGTKPD